MSTSTALVPASRVVALAMSVLEEADTIDRAFIHEWVFEGLKQLGPNISWYDEAVLYPVEYSFKKPDNMSSAIDFALYDSQDHELRFVLRGRGSRIHQSDNQLINDGEYAPGLGAPIDLSEDSHYYNIGTSAGAQAVAYAYIKFFKFPVDETGQLLIPEEDTMPLVYFIRHMWYLRKDDKMGIAQSNNKWIAARNEARGAHRTPSMLVGKEIARTWNSMIQKQSFKIF